MAFDYITLHSGTRFHVLTPKLDEININDIAWGLSNLCRFTGHTSRFYSVAQHSCLVCDLLPLSLKPEGLLHDGVESLINDLATPVKQYIPQYKALEVNIEKVISKKFKLKFPFHPDVKIADMTLLVTEMRDLMKNCDYKSLPFTPLPDKIVPWTSEQARREFIRRYKKYKRAA